MLLDVEDTDKLFGGKSGMQTALKAGKPWNVPEIEMYRLANAGILKPVMPADQLMEGARQFFRETDVKTVLDGLFAKAETLHPPSDRGQSICYVARRSTWSSAAIVQAVLDGRMWLGFVGEHHDFAQLRVDMSELKELDRQQVGDLILFHDAVQGPAVRGALPPRPDQIGLPVRGQNAKLANRTMVSFRSGQCFGRFQN